MQAIQDDIETATPATIVGRILVVEDDEQVRSAMCMLLEHHGYEVQVADDGEEGLEIARRMRPDVIVMDLVLPGLNGFDAAVALRQEESTAGIPIVAVTASWLGSEIEKLQEFGFDGALRKPFAGRELIDELGKHLGN